MMVLATARHARTDPEVGEVHAADRLHTLLPRADVVLVTVPLTPDTLGIDRCDRNRPDEARARAWSISAAHGVVDDEALMAALRAQQLSGCVYDLEDPAHRPFDTAMWTCPNLILLPHSQTNDPGKFMENVLDVFFENLSTSSRQSPAVQCGRSPARLLSSRSMAMLVPDALPRTLNVLVENEFDARAGLRDRSRAVRGGPGAPRRRWRPHPGQLQHRLRSLRQRDRECGRPDRLEFSISRAGWHARPACAGCISPAPASIISRRSTGSRPASSSPTIAGCTRPRPRSSARSPLS